MIKAFTMLGWLVAMSATAGFSTAAEIYNECDLAVLNSDLKQKQCNSASPPIDSAEGMGNRQIYINPKFWTTARIGYPGRPEIVDQNNRSVLIRGEAYSAVGLIFGKKRGGLKACFGIDHRASLCGAGLESKKEVDAFGVRNGLEFEKVRYF